MVGDGLQNAAVALLGTGEVVLVLEDDSEIDEAAERWRIPLQRLLVTGLGFRIVAQAVVDHAEGEQGARVAGITGDGLLICSCNLGDRRPGVGQKACLCSPEVGRRGPFAGDGIQFFAGVVVPAARPQRLGCGCHARHRVVAGLAGGGERLAGLVVGADGGVGQTLMEEGERPTVTRPQRLESVFRSAEQPLADAEPHRRRRAPLGAGLEFPHR